VNDCSTIASFAPVAWLGQVRSSGDAMLMLMLMLLIMGMGWGSIQVWYGVGFSLDLCGILA
jgi:hypothetical protein